MGRVILKAYEIGSNKVNSLVFDQVFNKYKNIAFSECKSSAEAYNTKWKQIKEMLEKKGPKVKHEDNIYYTVISLGNASFLIFAIGSGKKDTLEKIYQKALAEEQKKGTITNSKSVKSSVIDLGNTDIKDEIKFNAINNGQSVINKLNEDSSYKYLRHLLNDETVKNFKTDRKYLSSFMTEFANVIKSHKEQIDNYTVFNTVEIAKLLKEANELLKNDEDLYNTVIKG